MAARAIWKATLEFDGHSVPVKLYSAVSDRRVHFRLLDPDTLAPVSQRMVSPATDETVESDEVGRGYEVESGLLVRLDEAELEALEPEPSREIEVSAFLPEAEIDHRWYDRPYWLGPDGDEAAYFALAEALGEAGREGLARWVMRKKRYVGALRARGSHLALITLRHAEEVVDAGALPKPAATKPSAAESKMAKQLVEMLRGPFEPERYRDEYRDRVLELIEAKREGRVVPIPKSRKPKRDESLERMLARSLEQAGAA